MNFHLGETRCGCSALSQLKLCLLPIWWRRRSSKYNIVYLIPVLIKYQYRIGNFSWTLIRPTIWPDLQAINCVQLPPVFFRLITAETEVFFRKTSPKIFCNLRSFCWVWSLRSRDKRNLDWKWPLSSTFTSPGQFGLYQHQERTSWNDENNYFVLCIIV